jgi:hypothetical protein
MQGPAKHFGFKTVPGEDPTELTAILKLELSL